MIDRQMKNEKGFTLIEMMIAAAMSIVLLGAAIYTYTKQDKLLRNENRKIHLRDHARLAMGELLPLLRLTGAGFPPGDTVAARPALGVTNADVSTITIKANINGVSSNVMNDQTAGDVNILVTMVHGNDGEEFTAGDKVVFFNAQQPTLLEEKVLNNAGSFGLLRPLVLTSGIAANWSPVTDGEAVLGNQYREIIFDHNAGTQQITQQIDGGATLPIANKVSNLAFSYFDANGNPLTTLPLNAADRGIVRRMEVSITIMDETENDVTTTLTTNINLRNMGT